MGMGGGNENAWISLEEKLKYEQRPQRDSGPTTWEERREASAEVKRKDVRQRRRVVEGKQAATKEAILVAKYDKYSNHLYTNSERWTQLDTQYRLLQDSLEKVYSHDEAEERWVEINESPAWASLVKAWYRLQDIVVGTREFEKLRSFSKDLEWSHKTSTERGDWKKPLVVRSWCRTFAGNHSLSTLVAVLDLMGMAWVDDTLRDGTFATFAEWEAHTVRKERENHQEANCGVCGEGVSAHPKRRAQIIVAGLTPEEAYTAPASNLLLESFHPPKRRPTPYPQEHRYCCCVVS